MFRDLRVSSLSPFRRRDGVYLYFLPPDYWPVPWDTRVTTEVVLHEVRYRRLDLLPQRDYITPLLPFPSSLEDP